MSDNHINEKHDKLLLGIGIILVAVLILIIIVFVRCTFIDTEQIHIGITTTSGEITTTTKTTTLTTISSTSTTGTTTSSTTTEDSTSLETDCETTTITTTVDEVIVITNYPIIVVTDETTVSDEIIQKQQTTYTEPIIEETTDNTYEMKFVGNFKGTYYICSKGTLGGSGRELIDGSVGNGEVKGSIASRSLFNEFGYCNNGKRTKVYIESESCKNICGFYYLDDSTAECVLGVIDFFYTNESNSPFCGIGVLNDIKVYI